MLVMDVFTNPVARHHFPVTAGSPKAARSRVADAHSRFKVYFSTLPKCLPAHISVFSPFRYIHALCTTTDTISNMLILGEGQTCLK